MFCSSGVGSLLYFTLFYGIQKILFLLLELEHTYLLWVNWVMTITCHAWWRAASLIEDNELFKVITILHRETLVSHFVDSVFQDLGPYVLLRNRLTKTLSLHLLMLLIY